MPMKKFNYETYLKKRTYYFKNKDKLIEFINELLICIGAKNKEDMIISEFSLGNEIGKTQFSTVYEYEKEIEASKNIYEIQMRIELENIKIIVKLTELEKFKPTSFIKIFSNDRERIIKIEQEVLAISKKYRNKLSFFLNDWIYLSIYIVSSILMYYNIRKQINNQGFGDLTILDIFIVLPIVFLILVLMRMLEMIFVPSFRIKTKMTFLEKITYFDEENKNKLGYRLIKYAISTVLIPLIITIIFNNISK